MAILSTNILDIASRGMPTEYIYKTDTDPNVDTKTLDFASRGMPTLYMYAAQDAVVGGTAKYLLLLGVG